MRGNEERGEGGREWILYIYRVVGDIEWKIRILLSIVIL